MILLCTVISARGVAAVNVLGFAVPGARSHPFAVLRVAQELAKRVSQLRRGFRQTKAWKEGL